MKSNDIFTKLCFEHGGENPRNLDQLQLFESSTSTFSYKRV